MRKGRICQKNHVMKPCKTIGYEEKRSKFIAYVYDVSSQIENEAILKALRAEHPKARHLVHAARFENSYGVLISEMSEDHEPISSMKKTKDLLERKEIGHLGIYIVRYYGGTNLGASNLDRIYFTMAMKLLELVS